MLRMKERLLEAQDEFQTYRSFSMEVNMSYSDEEKVHNRLYSFLQLERNWDGDDEGEVFEKNGIDWAYAIIKSLLDNNVRKPHIFPETPNDVRLEWSNLTNNIIVTLLLRDHVAKMFRYDTKSKAFKKITLNLDNQKDSNKLHKELTWI